MASTLPLQPQHLQNQIKQLGLPLVYLVPDASATGNSLSWFNHLVSVLGQSQLAAIVRFSSLDSGLVVVENAGKLVGCVCSHSLSSLL